MKSLSIIYKRRKIKQIILINSENYLLRVVDRKSSILIQNKLDEDNDKIWLDKKDAKKLAIALLKLS